MLPFFRICFGPNVGFWFLAGQFIMDKRRLRSGYPLFLLLSLHNPCLFEMSATTVLSVLCALCLFLENKHTHTHTDKDLNMNFAHKQG